MSSIKVCLFVIIFICSNCTSVHQENDNSIVEELIFRTARLILGRNNRIGKKNLGTKTR